MYSSGKFAKLVGTTIRTIRYYDKLGILKAMRNQNGYRYYDEKQINDYFYIRELQLLGFSLEEIIQYKDSLSQSVLEEKKLQRSEQLKQIEDSIHIIETIKQTPNHNNHYSKIYQNRELTTSQVSRLLGITARTLRYYDNCGFVEAKRKQNQYRYYSGEQLDQIFLIRQLEKVGFTLLEINECNGIVSKDTLIEKEKRLYAQMKSLVVSISRLECMITKYTDLNWEHPLSKKKTVMKELIFQ